MKKFIEILSTISLLALFFVGIIWYIKGHTGRYWFWFWLNTILSICAYCITRTPVYV